MHASPLNCCIQVLPPIDRSEAMQIEFAQLPENSLYLTIHYEQKRLRRPGAPSPILWHQTLYRISFAGSEPQQLEGRC